MPAPRSTVKSHRPRAACTVLVAELDVDAAILLPALLVRAGRVELATRRVEELVAPDAEAGEERVRRTRALRAKGHVVLGLAARVGPADEIHGAALERTRREALGDLLEDRLLRLGELLRVEVELRRLF